MIDLNKNKTFCILPWVHLNTWPNGNVYQCCITDHTGNCGTTTTHTLEEIWNNDYMKDLRVSLMAGEKHSSCRRCYMLEETGLDSFRSNINAQFAAHIPAVDVDTSPDGHNSNFKLAYWDFRFSNICNLKCRMCGSGLSSSWADDHKKMLEMQGIDMDVPKIVHINANSKEDFGRYIVEFIDIVEEIYFAGGEPLLMEEHYFILDELIKRGRTNVRLRYNTNLSKLKYKQWDVLNYWKQFSNIKAYASVDAVDNLAEYIRSGTNWPVLSKNISSVVAFNKNMLGINITLQILNVFQLPKLLDYLLTSGMNFYDIMISNILSHPAYYSVQILPDHLKDLAITNLCNYLSTLPEHIQHYFASQVSGVTEFMYSELENKDQHRSKFKMMITMLDGFRNEDFYKECPELAEWFTSIT